MTCNECSSDNDGHARYNENISCIDHSSDIVAAQSMELFGFSVSNTNGNDLSLWVLPAGDRIELVFITFALLRMLPNSTCSSETRNHEEAGTTRMRHCFDALRSAWIEANVSSGGNTIEAWGFTLRLTRWTATLSRLASSWSSAVPPLIWDRELLQWIFDAFGYRDEAPWMRYTHVVVVAAGWKVIDALYTNIYK